MTNTSRETTSQHRGSILALTTGMLAGGIALNVTIAGLPDLQTPVVLPIWVLVASFAAAEMLVVHLPARQDSHTISLTEIPLLLGLVFAGPASLIVGRLVGSASALAIGRRQRGLKLYFNLALFYLETVTAIYVYRSLLGVGSPDSAMGFVAAAVAIGAMQLVGVTLVTLVIWIHDEKRTARSIAKTILFSSAASTAASLVGLVGLLALWHDVQLVLGVAGAALVLYLLMRWKHLHSRTS